MLEPLFQLNSVCVQLPSCSVSVIQLIMPPQNGSIAIAKGVLANPHTDPNIPKALLWHTQHCRCDHRSAGIHTETKRLEKQRAHLGWLMWSRQCCPVRHDRKLK